MIALVSQYSKCLDAEKQIFRSYEQIMDEELKYPETILTREEVKKLVYELFVRLPQSQIDQILLDEKNRTTLKEDEQLYTEILVGDLY